MISSPTITSGVRAALRVDDAIRSSRTRVVVTMAGSARARGAGGEERGDGGHAREGAGLVAGPEAILFAVGGDGGIHHGVGTPGARDLEAAGGEAHPGLPGDP